VSAGPGSSLFQAVLTFDETLDAMTAADRFNYSVSGGLVVTDASLDSSKTKVTLTFASQEQFGSNYCISATGVADCSGNAIPNGQTSVCCFSTPVLCYGVAKREMYMGIGNTDVPSLTSNSKYPGSPDVVNFAEFLEGPIDLQIGDGTGLFDNYGERISGFLAAPVTGAYNFWISSDDNSEFWLSTDIDPAHKVLVCREPQWATIRNWTDSA